MYVNTISTLLFSGMLMPAMRAMDQPCRCLCRGLEQITSTAPWRRMILHFSHIGLTDGRTFMEPFGGVSNRERTRAGACSARPRKIAQGLGHSGALAG